MGSPACSFTKLKLEFLSIWVLGARCKTRAILTSTPFSHNLQSTNNNYISGMSSAVPPLPSRFSTRRSKVRLYSSVALFAVLSWLQFNPAPTLLQSLTVPLDIDQAPTVIVDTVITESEPDTINYDGDLVNSYNFDNDLFNYTAFWQDAMNKAQESIDKEAAAPPSNQSCPKVFIYDLRKLNEIDTKNHPRRFANHVHFSNTSRDAVFKGYLHKTNQYAFASILEIRIRRYKCRTRHPEKADLFFVPVLSAPKGSGGWTSTCQAISGEKLRDSLPFLNSTNACRHFIAVGKGHTDLPFCKGWFSDPIPELRPFTRLAYSSFNFVLDKQGAHSYDPNDTIATTHPNMVSVPYPSSLHFYKNRTVPHFANISRHTLMSFIGKDNHGDVLVRKQIHNLCKKYNKKSICDFRLRFYPDRDATSKARTVFCLEPAGDTPGRKSLADSIAFGCIPVLFSELTDDVAPWHWLDWKDRARVLVPREDFVAGRIDLKKLLTSIPPDFLKLMQDTLKVKARKFQYSVDDDQEDGIRVILDSLYREAQAKTEQGTCGYGQLASV